MGVGLCRFRIVKTGVPANISLGGFLLAVSILGAHDLSLTLNLDWFGHFLQINKDICHVRLIIGVDWLILFQ